MTGTTPAPDQPSPIDYESLSYLLPARSRHAHKGDFGHVLVVGGDRGMGGAALMAAEAAGRCGAGLVSVATHPSHAAIFLARRPEVMARGINTPSELPPLLDQATVVVLGPGLGHSEWSAACFRQVMDSAAHRPLVMDADGLNQISRGECHSLWKERDNWILTPHPGEAGRLLERSTAAVQDDRPAAARDLLARYGGACVLKGAGSLVAYRHDGRSCLDQCNQGNPGMASGGMGDILSGVLGALLAQGLSLSQAARLGTCLHAHSADRAAAGEGERGLLATDLLPWLRRLSNPGPMGPARAD